jgi:hypothetical protein
MKTCALRRRFFHFVVVVIFSVCALRTPAQNIPIVNAGFESNSITDGAFVVLQPQGWATYDPNGIINNVQNAVGVIRPNLGGEYFPGGAPEGVNAALVFLAGPQMAEAGLQQTLTTPLQANTRYRCSVQIGNIASGTSLPGSSGGPGIFFNLNGFPGYRIDVLAGGTVIASDSNSVGATIPEGEFREARFHFDTSSTPAQLGQLLGIRLVNLKASGPTNAPNIEVDFDDVRLSAGPIPTPAQLRIALGGAFPAINLSGTTGATYRVEYSAALPATNWIALTNVFIPASPQLLLDPHAVTNAGSRYYRAVVVE